MLNNDVRAATEHRAVTAGVVGTGAENLGSVARQRADQLQLQPGLRRPRPGRDDGRPEFPGRQEDRKRQLRRAAAR